MAILALKELKIQIGNPLSLNNMMYIKLMKSLIPTSNAERKVIYSYLKQCTFLLLCISDSLTNDADFMHGLLLEYKQYEPKKTLNTGDKSARQVLLTYVNPNRQGKTTVLSNPNNIWGLKKFLKSCSSDRLWDTTVLQSQKVLNLRALWSQLKN